MKKYETPLRRSRLALVVGPWLALGACFGGLGNQALVGETTLRGRIEGAVDVEQAWVAIEGQPALTSTLDADGRFAIQGVPVGKIILLASNGKGAALRRELLVLDDDSAPLRLQLQQGLRLEGQVVLEGDDHARRAEMRLLGLPTHRVAFADGQFVVEGLPEACFEIEATHPTHQSARARVCLQRGQPVFVSLYLRARQNEEPSQPLPDAGAHDDDGGSVSPPPPPPPPPPQLLPVCSPCLVDADCMSGLCALEHSAGGDEKICATRCVEDLDCGSGFVCERLQSSRAGSACLPRQASCVAIDNQEAPCNQDEDCGLGDGEMLCHAGQCRLVCGDNEDCTGGRACVESDLESESLCL